MLGSWKISTATRELRFAAVKSFFRLMSEEGLVDRDVAAEVAFPERTSGRVEERPVLSDTEVSDAVARIGDQSPGRPPLLHRSHRAPAPARVASKWPYITPSAAQSSESRRSTTERRAPPLELASSTARPGGGVAFLGWESRNRIFRI
jgi:integrase